jgi:hypothetical protein
MATSWKSIVRDAKETTNHELAEEIANLTRLTTEEIDDIAPSKLDKTDLARLMKIVKDSTQSNEEKAAAIKKTDQFLSLLIAIAAKVA